MLSPVTHTCNRSIWEVEAGGWGVQGHQDGSLSRTACQNPNLVLNIDIMQLTTVYIPALGDQTFLATCKSLPLPPPHTHS